MKPFLESLTRPVLQLTPVLPARPKGNKGRYDPKAAANFRRERLLRQFLSIRQISEVVAKYYQLQEPQLHTVHRCAVRIGFPRQVAMLMAVEQGHTTEEIGKFYGRDRSSATHAAKTVQDICSVDRVVAAEVGELRKLLPATE